MTRTTRSTKSDQTTTDATPAQTPALSVPPSTDPNVRRGFKYLFAYTSDGSYVSSADQITSIQSYHDGSTWTVGTWRKPEHTRRIECCYNGLHMSPTPYQARDYVSGNVLALMEAKGESDDNGDKSAHAEMRIIAIWLHTDIKAVFRNLPTSADDNVSPEASTAFHEAVSTADRDYYAAQAANRDARDAALAEPTIVYNDAISAPTQQRDLEQQLARIEYEAATQAARAVYNAKQALATAEYTLVTRSAQTVYDSAKHEATHAQAVADQTASTVHRDLINAAQDAYNAAKAEASGTVAETILAALPAPSQVASE